MPELQSTVKEPNPKDAVGARKAPISTLPAPVLFEMGLGMLEGALKYGRHNYRAIGVRYSVYYDAAMRHLTAAWEGEDIDPDSGLPHLVKAMCCLAVLRDAQMQGKCHDDRPPKSKAHWLAEMNAAAARLIADGPAEPKQPYTQLVPVSPTDVDAAGSSGDVNAFLSRLPLTPAECEQLADDIRLSYPRVELAS